MRSFTFVRIGYFKTIEVVPNDKIVYQTTKKTFKTNRVRICCKQKTFRLSSRSPLGFSLTPFLGKV